MPDGFAYDVFLSHSSKDKPAVLALAERLRCDGVTVWLDDWGIAPGEHIPSALEKGLRESRHLVLCMSVNGLGSDWVKAETWATLFSDPLNQARRVLPLRLDDVTVTGFLEPLKAIDWRDQRDAEYQKLLTACRVIGSVPLPPIPDMDSTLDVSLPSETLPPLPVGVSYSAAAKAFHEQLFSRGQKAWLSLKKCGLVAIFQELTKARNWAGWQETPTDFFQFCLRPEHAGFPFLNLFLEALEDDERAGGGSRYWDESLRIMLLALSNAAIDAWVNHEARGVPISPPAPGKPIRLELESPWVIYLLIVYMYKLEGGVPENFDLKKPEMPRPMIPLKAPVEGPEIDDLLRPATDALAAVLRSEAEVKANPISKELVMEEHSRRKKVLGGYDIIFAISDGPEHQAFHSEEFNRLVNETYNTPIAVISDQTRCSRALQQFINDLTSIVSQLNGKLRHQGIAQSATAKDAGGTPPPIKPKGAAVEKPGNTFIFNAPAVVSTGEKSTIAQAAASHAQAAGRNIVNNGADSASFTAALDAFVAEIKASAVLKPKYQSLVEASVNELHAFAENPAGSPNTVDKVKEVLEDVDDVLEKLESGAEVVEKITTRWEKVKTWAAVTWPVLAALINRTGNGS